MQERHLFTSESVSEGHPDKIADQISDAILDAMLKKDPNSRVACETTVTTGLVLVVGEISTNAYVDIQSVVRGTIKKIGYTKESGFDPDSVGVLVALDEQSPDIAQGVDESLEARDSDTDPLDKIGAGDQGMMFGFAIDETDTYMPLPISLAHALMRQTDKLRHAGEISYLRPDAKAQVTVEYDDNEQPVRVDTVVLSVQHDPDVTLEEIRRDVEAKIIRKIIPADMMDDDTKIYVNPTGRFVLGGPQADSGGFARHGGGAFSGKDATKVDRSASYAARYIAKNIVAAGLAKRVEVQLAYAIGVAKPVSVSVNTFGTNVISEQVIEQAIRENFDLRPAGIIKMLDLKRPIYEQTAAYGHFGRTDVDLPWEHLDKVQALLKYRD